jgi:hypothetical protein
MVISTVALASPTGLDTPMPRGLDRPFCIRRPGTASAQARHDTPTIAGTPAVRYLGCVPSPRVTGTFAARVRRRMRRA